MKSKFTLFLLLCCSALRLLAQNISTGIDNAGNALAIGDLDPNWTLVQSPNLPSVEVRACGYYPGYWQPAPIACTNAMWVNFSGDYMNNIPGTYTFERPFIVDPGTPSFLCNFRIAFDDIPLSASLISPTGTVIPLPYTMTAWYHLTQLIQHEEINPAPGQWRVRVQINFFDSAAAFMLSGDIRQCGVLLPQHLRDDLIAYYPFNGGSLLDYSPNHLDLNNPTGVPSVAGDRNGMPNCAYEFTGGTSDYLTAPMPAGMLPDANTPFSISLWYKPNSSNATGYELIFGRGASTACPDGIGEVSVGLYDCRMPTARFDQYSTQDQTMYGTWCGDMAANYLVRGWQHIAVVYDPSLPQGSRLSIYRDGNLSYNQSGPCGNSYVDAGDIMVGLGFQGMVDDIFFYKRALTTSEVHELLAMGSSCCQFLITSNAEPTPLQGMQVVPNPNRGVFQCVLPSGQGPYEATLLDAMGRTVWERTIPNGMDSFEVSCGNQPGGVYFLRLRNETGSAVERVVIE